MEAVGRLTGISVQTDIRTLLVNVAERWKLGDASNVDPISGDGVTVFLDQTQVLEEQLLQLWAKIRICLELNGFTRLFVPTHTILTYCV